MQIGKYTLHQPLFLAPMEDVTDASFRIICKRLGADVTITEFTAAEALIRHVGKAFKKIHLLDEERPAGVQIFGSRPDAMKEAAQLVEASSPDFIDINCGCWVKNHVNRLEGAGLLKDLKLFEAVVKATVAGTKLPVTVKTRLGWDEKSIVIMDVAKMVEQAGAKMLTLHCRTRSQGHQGTADWRWLEKVKKTISIPLIGNGDAMNACDVKMMFETGCDGVMIGRGAITNPWIFQQAKHYLKTEDFLSEPTLKERINICLEHLQLSCSSKACKNPAFAFRKHFVGYLKGIPHISQIRNELMKIDSVEGIQHYLQNFLNQH